MYWAPLINEMNQPFGCASQGRDLPVWAVRGLSGELLTVSAALNSYLRCASAQPLASRLGLPASRGFGDHGSRPQRWRLSPERAVDQRHELLRGRNHFRQFGISGFQVFARTAPYFRPTMNRRGTLAFRTGL